MQRIHLRKEPRLEAKHNAFSFQADAVNTIKDLEYSAIFFEQGLGKSKIAIDLMLNWLDKKVVDTVLFVAKKSLINNWQREFGMHTFMKPKMLTQDKKANYFAFNTPSRVLLTHYEVLRTEKERLQLFLKVRNVAVILDESAKIKNPNSSLTKAILDLAPLFQKRVIMTGTPIANRPFDIWAQTYFLDQGKSLGNDFNSFKRSTDLSNKLSHNEKAQMNFESNLQDIFKRISSFSIRETKQSGVIELPQKIIKTINVDWESTQFSLYRQFRDETKVIIMKDGIPAEDDAEYLLKRLLRLVEIASNPRLVDEGYHNNPGKMSDLLDLVHTICDKGEKCIIWSAFTANVDWLTRELRRFGTCKIHGKLNMVQRNNAVEKFLSNDDTRILIATPGSAKEGLTLTSANHVIFYDRTFSLDDYLQAQDRIHRISQVKTCYVYNMIMKESIDEWIDCLIEAKHLAAQLAQGDITLEHYRSQISYEFGDIVRGVLGIDSHSNSHIENQ